MNVIEVCNPVLTCEILMKSFSTMPPAEFQKVFDDIVRRGEAFTKRDDSKFSATLTEAEATMYASHAQQFIEALNKLKQCPAYQEIRWPALAKTIALWQVVTTFKTLHGTVSPSE